MEDGFKYKRRKSGTPGARAGPSSHRVSGGAMVLKSEKSETRDVSQRLSSSLPPDYPGLSVHERVPERSRLRSLLWLVHQQSDGKLCTLPMPCLQFLSSSAHATCVTASITSTTAAKAATRRATAATSSEATSCAATTRSMHEQLCK